MTFTEHEALSDAKSTLADILVHVNGFRIFFFQTKGVMLSTV
jgi:hypothetical protein